MGDMQPAGWVLYDDACGFCRQWVPFWRETLSKRGFSIAPPAERDGFRRA